MFFSPDYGLVQLTTLVASECPKIVGFQRKTNNKKQRNGESSCLECTQWGPEVGLNIIRIEAGEMLIADKEFRMVI